MKTMLNQMLLVGAFAISAGSAVADSAHEIGGVRKFDLDGNGEITRAEFDEGYERKMQEKLAWLDENKDGVVSPDEFRKRHREEYDERWSQWDDDGDGMVSVQQLMARKHAQRAKMMEGKQ